jgi:hypothetical protein
MSIQPLIPDTCIELAGDCMYVCVHALVGNVQQHKEEVAKVKTQYEEICHRMRHLQETLTKYARLRVYCCNV